jgi:cytochrome b subunit of formate dehydrogenase
MNGDAQHHREQPGQKARGRRWNGGMGVIVWVTLLAAGVAQGQTRVADPDRRCQQCHGQPHIGELNPLERRSMVGTWLGESENPPSPPFGSSAAAPPGADEPEMRPALYVDRAMLAASPHQGVKCVQCHEDADRLPHPPKLNRATCAKSCHAPAWEAYMHSSHDAALLQGDAFAPTCVSCHGGHDMLRIGDRRAAQHRLNSLYLCGDCHTQHGPDANGVDAATRVSNYLASSHARGVVKGGLMGAATCVDCHSAHRVLPSKEPHSTVHRAQIPETCGRCHAGVLETYAHSVHGRVNRSNGATEAAVCTDCHTAHAITRASSPHFLRSIVEECGECHDTPAQGARASSYQTYASSYHGQVTRLGGLMAARCSDCHGSHDILPLNDPASSVNKHNLIETCGRCHPGANANFVLFDPHANHRDAANYPILHAVWLYFMIMMGTVFTFFGLHTVLWLIRSSAQRARHGRAPRAAATTVVRRFTTLDRVNHALVAITFFGLTATGIPLVFSHQAWARTLAELFGGIEEAGMWHRFFAIVLIINLIVHVLGLLSRFIHRRVTWRRWLFGPNSMVPRWKDAKDCAGMFRWFAGRGPRPAFDRWTYWEKFDYWAEVGGTFIIGGSGLLLWFPELASRLLPGWIFNVAMIVHGYEALLAIGFIFTIHFFNTHIRPGAFPVDEVIFTGTLPEEELRHDRPEEYRRLVESGEIDSLRSPAPPGERHPRPLLVVIAVVSVSIGLTLLALIVLGGLELI